MNAPVVWIVLPGILALALLPFRHWKAIVLPIAAGAALLLALAAWLLPFNEAMSVGPFSLKVAETLSVLGRSFTLADAERPLLGLFYLAAGLWILGAYLVRVNDLFPPLALGMTALWIGALAVEPFLYAAMLIEVTVLLSVPLLVPVGERAGRGVFRYVAFQTFGMPFLLFTGWLLEGVEASPSDLALVVRAAVLLALGFAFLLAIFPFHSWMPMLMEEAHPYVVGFILTMLFGLAFIFGLGFLNRYAWLRDSPIIYEMLGAVGAMMALLGGLWAAFQSHLGRVLGFGVMLEVGYSLLGISLIEQAGLDTFFAAMAPRTMTLLIWAVALGRAHTVMEGDLSFASLRSLWRRAPFLCSTLLLALFSIAGIPLLAVFPARYVLWAQLAAWRAPLAVFSLLGSLGLLAGGWRSLAAMLTGEERVEKPKQSEQGEGALHLMLFAVSAGLLVLFGVMPQLSHPLWAQFSLMFDQLIP